MSLAPFELRIFAVGVIDGINPFEPLAYDAWCLVCARAGYLPTGLATGP